MNFNFHIVQTQLCEINKAKQRRLVGAGWQLCLVSNRRTQRACM